MLFKLFDSLINFIFTGSKYSIIINQKKFEITFSNIPNDNTIKYIFNNLKYISNDIIDKYYYKYLLFLTFNKNFYNYNGILTKFTMKINLINLFNDNTNIFLDNFKFENVNVLNT